MGREVLAARISTREVLPSRFLEEVLSPKDREVQRA